MPSNAAVTKNLPITARNGAMDSVTMGKPIQMAPPTPKSALVLRRRPNHGLSSIQAANNAEGTSLNAEKKAEM
eukprot:CAMPEP_0180808540 /NCGR_PEP_ID=MMETSP1038_2-20121128/63851_1 /TAXON_ID=632150 /ORGANISM="Azadinium spinosum, Strain 3D9" /LENGTH=72 /DNA_ID=CAMNT_0022849661 /DNA_START=80 /DNA_END=298 /DNA_ORIENTATION=+